MKYFHLVLGRVSRLCKLLPDAVATFPFAALGKKDIKQKTNNEINYSNSKQIESKSSLLYPSQTWEPVPCLMQFLEKLSLTVGCPGSSLQRPGFPLLCLLSLQSTGSRSGRRQLWHLDLAAVTRALELGLKNRDAWASWLHAMCSPPGPGIKAVSPALTGRSLSTAPPGKSLVYFFK